MDGTRIWSGVRSSPEARKHQSFDYYSLEKIRAKICENQIPAFEEISSFFSLMTLAGEIRSRRNPLHEKFVISGELSKTDYLNLHYSRFYHILPEILQPPGPSPIIRQKTAAGRLFRSGILFDLKNDRRLFEEYIDLIEREFGFDFSCISDYAEKNALAGLHIEPQKPFVFYAALYNPEMMPAAATDLIFHSQENRKQFIGEIFLRSYFESMLIPAGMIADSGRKFFRKKIPECLNGSFFCFHSKAPS